MSTPEIDALFTEFHTFPTSDAYEQMLLDIEKAVTCEPTSSQQSESPLPEASLLPSSSTPASNELQMLLAASALITKLESICSSGVLPLADEISARELIVTAARACGFLTQAERSES